jgi:hypothetical protein
MSDKQNNKQFDMSQQSCQAVQATTDTLCVPKATVGSIFFYCSFCDIQHPRHAIINSKGHTRLGRLLAGVSHEVLNLPFRAKCEP